jgi:hypothetical protein
MSGHLVRMSDDRAVNKVFLGKTEGRRKAARPKLRCTENNLKSMDVNIRRNKREDRYLWDVILKAALVKI